MSISNRALSDGKEHSVKQLLLGFGKGPDLAAAVTAGQPQSERLADLALPPLWQKQTDLTSSQQSVTSQ